VPRDARITDDGDRRSDGRKYFPYLLTLTVPRAIFKGAPEARAISKLAGATTDAPIVLLAPSVSSWQQRSRHESEQDPSPEASRPSSIARIVRGTLLLAREARDYAITRSYLHPEDEAVAHPLREIRRADFFFILFRFITSVSTERLARPTAFFLLCSSLRGLPLRGFSSYGVTGVCLLLLPLSPYGSRLHFSMLTKSRGTRSLGQEAAEYLSEMCTRARARARERGSSGASMDARSILVSCFGFLSLLST